MGVRYPSVATNVALNVLPATNAETIICTTPPLTIPLDFAQIIIFWFAQITTGTSTTSLQMRVRRGATLAGAIIGTGWTLTIGAALNALPNGCYIDTPGAVAGQQYTLTCSQQGVTVAGTLIDQCLIAFAL